MRVMPIGIIWNHFEITITLTHVIFSPFLLCLNCQNYPLSKLSVLVIRFSWKPKNLFREWFAMPNTKFATRQARIHSECMTQKHLNKKTSYYCWSWGNFCLGTGPIPRLRLCTSHLLYANKVNDVFLSLKNNGSACCLTRSSYLSVRFFTEGEALY